MSDGDDDRPRRKSRAELAVDILDSYSTWVGLGLVVGVIGLTIVLATRGVPQVPRYWRVFGIAALATGALGYPAVVKILRWLYDPPKRFLVQPAASADEGGIWQLSPSEFEDLHVRGGELYQWPGCKHPTYEVEWYREKFGVCKGTWRGSASDGEMIQNQNRINEIRDHLEGRAKERDILMTRCETIVREAILENARLLVEEYNRASLINVSALTERVDNILESADLTSELQDIDSQRTDPEADNEPEAVDQPTQAPASSSPQAEADGGRDQ